MTIQFFYGSDTFSLQKEVKKIKHDFQVKEGADFSLVTSQGEKLNFNQFVESITTDSLFTTKKLILIKNLIIENPDKDLKKKIADYLSKISSGTDLIFVEEGLPDRRESLFKSLSSGKFPVKVFSEIDSFRLVQWIRNKVGNDNLKISNQAAAKLALYLGPNLWRQDMETDKLILLAKAEQKETIDETDVDNIVEPEGIAKVFDLTDALAAKNGEKVVEIMADFNRKGEDESMIFNMIIYQFRNMLMVSELAGTMPKDSIAREVKLHPFVVQKVLALKNSSLSKLLSAYEQLCSLDWAIKSGEIETKTALSLFVVEFCRK